MSAPKILVVNDSEFDRLLITRVLGRHSGHVLLEADSGERCLELIVSESPDLILLDIVMPGLSGLELLRRIREHALPIVLPVIMVSAKSDASDVVEYLSAGANDFITKPVNFAVAMSRISTHLGLANSAKQEAALRQLSVLETVVASAHLDMNHALSTALSLVESGDLNAPAVKTLLRQSLWSLSDSLGKLDSVRHESSSIHERISEAIHALDFQDGTF